MDDRALVDALVSGDPRGLEGAYRAYAERLYTYCRGLVRDADAAADAVHDTFVLASQRAGQLRDPDKLRPWLYAIARNECLRLLRGRGRQVPLDEAGQVTAPVPDPVAGLHAAEIQELVWAAADGLNPGDREVFELSVRHDLPAQEVGEALGVSVAHAHARLSRTRSQLERALGALLVARTGREECPELATLLRDWDGKLTALMRKRISRHVESCEVCGERQRRQLTPAALFAAYAALPFLVVPAELLPRLQLTSFDPGMAAARDEIVRRAGRFRSDNGFPRPYEESRRRLAVAGVSAVAVAAVLAFGAGALIPPAVDPAAQAPPASPTPVAAAPAVPTTPTASPTPAGSPTPSAAPSPTLGPGQPPPPPAGPPPAGPPPPPPPNPPPNTPPSINRQVARPGEITPEPSNRACPGSVASQISALVMDAEDPPESLVVTFTYLLSTDSSISGTGNMSHQSNGTFTGQLGPFAYGKVPPEGGVFTIRIAAIDSGGAETRSEITVALLGCKPAG